MTHTWQLIHLSKSNCLFLVLRWIQNLSIVHHVSDGKDYTNIYIQRDTSALHRRQSCATIENVAITHDKRQLIRELFSRLQLRAHVERWRQDRAEVLVEKRGDTAGPVDCAMLRSPVNVDIFITNAPQTDLRAGFELQHQWWAVKVTVCGALVRSNTVKPLKKASWI